MLWLLVFIVVMGGGMYYIFKLDFEWGSGFTEIRKYIREAEYTVVKREDSEKDEEVQTLPERTQNQEYSTSNTREVEVIQETPTQRSKE